MSARSDHRSAEAGGSRAVGRPCKLTSAVRSAIAAATAKGASRSAAAASSKVGESTLYEWLAAGESDARSGRRTKFSEFSEAIKKADGEVELGALEAIRAAAADGHWQAAAWLLERKFPGRWAKRDAQALHEDTIATFQQAVYEVIGEASPELQRDVRQRFDASRESIRSRLRERG